MDCVSIAVNMTAAHCLITGMKPSLSCEVISRDSPCVVFGTFLPDYEPKDSDRDVPVDDGIEVPHIALLKHNRNDGACKCTSKCQPRFFESDIVILTRD